MSDNLRRMIDIMFQAPLWVRYIFDVTWIMSDNLRRMIFFSSLIATCTSRSGVLASLSTIVLKMASFLFSLAHMTNGWWNFSIYSLFFVFIRSCSLVVRSSNPAYVCSLLDCADTAPCRTNFPARFGWPRSMPFFTENMKINVICLRFKILYYSVYYIIHRIYVIKKNI